MRVPAPSLTLPFLQSRGGNAVLRAVFRLNRLRALGVARIRERSIRLSRDLGETAWRAKSGCVYSPCSRCTASLHCLPR